MRTSARAIVIKENHLLVEVVGEICFPLGGRLELSETIKEALQRELKEEIPGAVFKIETYLGKIFNRWQEKEKIIESEDHYFKVSFELGEISAPLLPGEIDRVFNWISMEELERENLMPALLRGLLREFHNGTHEEWDLINDEVRGVS